MFGQDATIFLKQSLNGYPTGSKVGATAFSQSGTRIKPGYVHLQGSGSDSQDIQRMQEDGAILTILSYNQNMKESDTPANSDKTYGLKVYKETDERKVHGREVYNYGIYSQTVIGDYVNDYNYSIYGKAAVGANSYAGYFEGNAYVTYDLNVAHNVTFGNDPINDHTFTGSIYALSNVEVDGYISASGDLYVEGDISSSNDIYADGDIFAVGDVTAKYSSDKRLKDNLIPISNSLNMINTLTGYSFDWNYPSKERIYSGHDVGLVAQEVQKIVPEAVKIKKDGYLSLEYHKIIPLLVNSIKEQQTQINDLMARLLKLEGENK